MFKKLHSAVTIGMAVLALAIAAYAMVQDRRLDDVTRQLDRAVQQRNAAERALIVLADQHAEELARKTTAAAGREAILSLDVTDEPPVGESLRRSLQIADEIGGLK